jgi:hypothetical protein
VLGELERTPARLDALRRRARRDARRPPPGGGFSLVEHLWHLADLEREGYGWRISRLAEGGRPFLPDFDGDRLAREREYRRRDVAEGASSFRRARAANLEALRRLRPRQWSHSGTQEGVGHVRLRDLPRQMLEHDRAHLREIRQLLGTTARPDPPRRRATAPGWHVLIHQIPPRPLYLRAKIRNRLARVGAVALKNSVYVLPARDACLEDVRWIAREAAAGGGEAYVCRCEFLHGVDDGALVRRFRAEAAARYGALRHEVREAARQLGRPGGAGGGGSVARLRRRLGDLRKADFFDAPGRKEVEEMVSALARGRRAAAPSSGRRRGPAARRA